MLGEKGTGAISRMLSRRAFVTQAVSTGIMASLTVNLASPGLARDRQDVLDAAFSQAERRIISEFYGGRRDRRQRDGRGHRHGSRDGRGHSRGRGRQLPPGLARQLDERGRLPPGLEKRGLPRSLAQQLGPAPRGTRRYVVGSDVLLVEEATDLVLDFLIDVVR